ncbi:arginase-like protein [Sarocladium implicatum]|nr:arginase-like protein [Sarocladium implicatum]
MVATSMMSESDMTYERRPAHVRTYNWPPFYLNLWIFVMLLASGSIMGVFSIFIQTQERLNLGIPWYFPYFIAVAAHTVVFIFGLFWLIYNRRLLPAIVMIGAFMLFVLWMVGLVVTSVELWGPSGSVNGVCNMQVFNKNPMGASEATLAWMQQKNICESWRLVFAMALVGVVFLVWIMIMSYQVFVKS